MPFCPSGWLRTTYESRDRDNREDMNCSIARVYQLPWRSVLSLRHRFKRADAAPHVILSSFLHICFFFPLQISFKHFWIFLIFFSLPQDILVPNPSVFLPCVLNKLKKKKKPPASVIELGDLTLCPAQLNSVSLLLQQWLNPSGSFTSSFTNTLLGNTSANIVPEPLLSLGYNMYHQVAFNSLLHVLYKVSLTEAFSI